MARQTTIDERTKVPLGVAAGLLFSVISFSLIYFLNNLNTTLAKLDNTISTATVTLTDHEKRISVNEVEIKTLQKRESRP